jgi:hypothetical protein
VSEDLRRRLTAAGIEYMQAGEHDRYFFLVRPPFAVMIDSFGGTYKIGAAGRMTERGLAVLVWRDKDPWFQTKGFAEAAGPEDIESLRRFQADVESALAPETEP